MKTTLILLLFATASFGQDNPLTAVDVKSAKRRAAPRMADGHPDFSGYWKGTRDTTPGGNIGKDLPGFKLPLTPAGEAALKRTSLPDRNKSDPSLCIIGGIPRQHNASGLPFEVTTGTEKMIAFLLIGIAITGSVLSMEAQALRRSGSVIFRRREIGHWDGDTARYRTPSDSKTKESGSTKTPIPAMPYTL
jgi:hypothetical protein